MSHCEAVTSFVSSFWMGEKEIKKKRYTHTHKKKEAYCSPILQSQLEPSWEERDF